MEPSTDFPLVFCPICTGNDGEIVSIAAFNVPIKVNIKCKKNKR